MPIGVLSSYIIFYINNILLHSYIDNITSLALSTKQIAQQNLVLLISPKLNFCYLSASIPLFLFPFF